jgi:hypothetical protein
MNVDALNKNPMGAATNDDDFNEDIHDIGNVQVNTPKTNDQIFSI